MTNNNHRQDSRHYQSPESIRDEAFPRRMLGIDAAKAYEFLDLLADQVQATESELSESRAENERLRAELQRVQAELDEYEQVGDRVNEQVVQLFSQAQLVAEEMVQDVSRDARERIGQARAHERKVVEEAMDTAGQHVRSYALAAQAQMKSIMDSFATEVDQLASMPPSGESGSAATQQSDPLFDELKDWQVHSRNGSGPESSPGYD
jgi:cell division septum initiation protein DivIVA